MKASKMYGILMASTFVHSISEADYSITTQL